jgi:hypothetical protein
MCDAITALCYVWNVANSMCIHANMGCICADTLMGALMPYSTLSL